MTPSRQAIHADPCDDLDGLRLSILRRISTVARAAGVDEHEIGCSLVGGPADLGVTLTGLAVARGVQDAMSVRVLDAIHRDGRTFGRVSLTFRFDAPDRTSAAV